MTFILTDIGDDSRDLQIANRIWLPLAVEIQCARILPQDKGNKIGFHLCTEVTSEEAAAIARHLLKLLQKESLPEDLDHEVTMQIASFIKESAGFSIC